MLNKYRDVISGSVLLIVSIIMFTATFSIKRLTVSRIGSQFMPQLVFGFLAVLSIIIIYDRLKKARLYDSSIKADEKSSEEKVNTKAVLATFAALAVYAFLLETVGFLIMTALYLFVQISILSGKKNRKLPTFAIIAVSSSVIIYYTFRLVFDLMLPAGILG